MSEISLGSPKSNANHAFFYTHLTPGKSEQTEADVTMPDILKKSAIVSEAVNMDKIAIAGNCTEERGSRDFGGNAGGENETTATEWPNNRMGSFGEDGVGVDVTAAGEWVAAGFAEQEAPACCLTKLYLKLAVQGLVGEAVALGKCCDQLLTCCGVRRVGDLSATGGEEFLFLELDALPRRVTDNTREAAGPTRGSVDVGGTIANAKDVGELYVPVEEPVVAGQIRY